MITVLLSMNILFYFDGALDISGRFQDTTWSINRRINILIKIASYGYSVIKTVSSYFLTSKIL